MHTYISFHKGVCLSSRRFLTGGFCPGWLLAVPLLSEYIHYNRKLNITFNFRFHTYEKFFNSVTSHALGPSLCHKLSHLLGPPSFPSSVTYFMDGPYRKIFRICLQLEDYVLFDRRNTMGDPKWTIGPLPTVSRILFHSILF